MAQLPDLTALGPRPEPTLPRRTPNIATYRPTSGMEGVPAAEMAQSGEHMQAATTVAMMMKEQQDSLRVEDAFNQLRKKQVDLTSGQNGYQNLKGSDAVNKPVLTEYGAAFDTVADALGNGLDNDFQRKLLAHRASIAGLELRQGIVHHIAQQSDVYATDVYKNTVQSEIATAAADPAATGMAIARIDAAAKNYATRFGKQDTGFVENEQAAARSAIFAAQIKTQITLNPIAAESYLKTPAVWNSLKPDVRAVLLHEVTAAALPVRANMLVAKAMTPEDTSGIQADLKVRGEPAMQEVSSVLTAPTRKGEQSRDTFNATLQEGGESGVVTPDVQRERDMKRIALIKTELASPNNDANDRRMLTKELADTEARMAKAPASNVIPISAAVETGMRKVDIKATLGQSVAKVRALAFEQYPDNPVMAEKLADISEQKLKSQLTTMVQGQQAIELQAGNRIKARLNGVDDKGNRTQPVPLIDLLNSDPQSRADFSNLSAASQAAMYTLSDAITNRALGSPSKVSHDLEQKAFERMVLPDGDPNKIVRPAQLDELVPKGLGLDAHNSLSKKLTEINAGGRQVQKWVADARSTARTMLMASMSAEVLAHPDLAREAANRFNANLDDKIHQLHAAGKDDEIPNLFIAGNSAYALDPNRVAAYMPTSSQIAAAKAQGSRTGAPIPGAVTAPTGAIDYLKSHPESKDAFKQKYGYLPAGM